MHVKCGIFILFVERVLQSAYIFSNARAEQLKYNKWPRGVAHIGAEMLMMGLT